MRVGRLTWPTSRLGRFCCIRATFAWRFTGSATSETRGLFRPSRQTRYLLIYISSFVTSFRQSPTPIHQNISENSGTGVSPHFGRRSSPKGGSFTRDRANANKELFVDMFVFAPQLWGRFVLKTAFYLSLRTCRSRGCRRPMPTRTSTSSCCTRYKTLSINRHTLFRK